MARLIPALNTVLRRMQAGEKRFARRLESQLEDDYLFVDELCEALETKGREVPEPAHAEGAALPA